jgi:hypothetical protein
MRSVILGIILVLVALPLVSCRTSNNGAAAAGDPTLICEKEGNRVQAVRPPDDVLELSKEFGVQAALETAGKDTVNASIEASLKRAVARLRKEKPNLDTLQVQLYHLAISYCNGGITHKKYQELSELAYRAAMDTEGPGGPPPGEIEFFEGNAGTQDSVHQTSDRAGQNFRPRQNDEARSVVLRNVRVGCRITVFDSPDGHRSDDYCVITVIRASPRYVVGTFERTFSDDVVEVRYTPRNGLDGKVSRIRID